MKKGLTRESVLDAAEELIKRGPPGCLTTGALAEKLGVKPASLYNHIRSTDELFTELGLRAIHALSRVLSASAKNVPREEAFFALANAYRDFAHNSPGQYFLILRIPMSGDGTLAEALPEMVKPILSLLDGFSLTAEEKNHWQRVLRSVMHGFSTEELCGYFAHSTADRDESYRLAISTVLAGILAAEAANASHSSPKEETIPL